MRFMKTKFKIGALSALMLFASSCDRGIDEFLDKAPGVDITEDVIFSSKRELLSFIAGIYFEGIPSGYPYKGFNAQSGNVLNTGAATEEGDLERSWYPSNDWNQGVIGAGAIIWHEDAIYNTRWEVLRRIHTVLERIDEVPDLTTEEYNQFKGEVLFIRALSNFELLKRYGGFPIVNKRFKLTDELTVPRSSVAECVEFILKDCDDAIALLPHTNVGIDKGRATKGAPMMLKSRLLLLAASPLFNTSTPYMDLGEHNDLISLGNEDQNRWKAAADAAMDVINWAQTFGGVHLITDQGVENNYEYAWSTPDNPEIIFSDKGINSQSHWSMNPWGNYVPGPIYAGQVGSSVPMNHVMKYEKRDGTPQTWNMAGGDDLNEKYEELDYRFRQSIAYNGSYWNEDYPVVSTYVGGAHAAQCLGGAWLRKGIPRALTRANPVTVNWTVFRLAEAYLNYAEAINEFEGPANAYAYVNAIRSRSGMPDLPGGLTKEQFRERVRKERDIELFFEDHRFWDIRRWMVAEEDGVMKGDFYGLKIYPIGTDPVTTSTEFRYEFYVFEQRVFNRRMYLHPYPSVEYNKGYLIQNPGYVAR